MGTGLVVCRCTSLEVLLCIDEYSCRARMTFALITGRINCASRMSVLAARYQNDNGESKQLPALTAIFCFVWEVWGERCKIIRKLV